MFGLNSIFKKKKKTTGSTSALIVDIYGRPVEDALEYFYPKQIKGVPVFSVDSIYNHYQDKINVIKKNSGIGEHRVTEGVKQLDELFTNVIKNYIEYVHMLPASENHHHSSPGGLIVHSLEASIFAQRYAREVKPDSVGMQDLDRQALPVYRYAAWLAAFLHDAGKVLCDIVVDAVDLELDGFNIKSSKVNPVPSWRPQTESLISWAKRFHVATYSVTYLSNRIHNKHNVDAIQILNPVIGKGFALNYLLNSPAEIHSKLVRVLAGYDNGKDYIAAAVRRGDMLSTSRNVATLAGSHYLTEQKLSTSAKIFKAMKLARSEWEYNRPNAHAWVIGGEVYLRYQKTFHSIINTAKKNELVIPSDIRTILTIMEDNGIIEGFDEQHKSIKFSAGEFTEKQLANIKLGKDVMSWEELIKVKWNKLIFDDEPMPNSAPGIILLSQSDTLLEVDQLGVCKEFIVETMNEEPTPTSSEEPVASEKNIAQPIDNDVKPPESKSKPTSVKQKAKLLVQQAKSGQKPALKSLEFKNKKSPVAIAPVDKEPPLQQNEALTTNITDGTNKPETTNKSMWNIIHIDGDANKCFVELGEVLKFYEISDKKLAIEKLTKAKCLIKNNDKPNIQTLRDGVGSLLVVEIDNDKLNNLVRAKGKPISDSKTAPGENASGAKGKPISDSKTAPGENASGAKGKSISDSKTAPGENASGAKGKSISDNKTAPGENASGAKGKSISDNKTTPGENASGAKGKSNSDSKTAHGSGTTAFKSKPPSENGSTMENHASFKESASERDQQLDDAADYGLVMRIKSAQDGTLGNWLKKYINSMDDNGPLSEIVIESQGKTAIKQIELLNFINKNSGKSKVHLRHISKAIRCSGETHNLISVNDIDYIEVESDKLNSIHLEL